MILKYFWYSMMRMFLLSYIVEIGSRNFLKFQKPNLGIGTLD